MYRVIILAIIALGLWLMTIVVRMFWIVSFRIPTDSMEPAILPGDNILAFRMKEPEEGRMPLNRNDVIVFSFPYPESWDSIGAPDGRYYIKRCVALAGDTLEIREGRYSVRGCDNVLGNVDSQDLLRERLVGVTEDSVARQMGICLDAWPQKDTLGWTVLKFGPLFVPCIGSVIELDDESFVLYRNYIEWEQGLKLKRTSDGCFTLGDKPVKEYMFMKDYCFVAGDRTENSQDSRYWGLLPYGHICAKAWRVWRSTDPYTGHTRYGRTGMKVK